MSALVRTIRAIAAEYSREFGTSIEDMLRDSLLGLLAILVLFIDTMLLLTAAGGGQ